jgi:hypothetical protein
LKSFLTLLLQLVIKRQQQQQQRTAAGRQQQRLLPLGLSLSRPLPSAHVGGGRYT